MYPSCIPIVRIEGNISVANDNTTYKRKQFPLKLCYAATIHKYQGRSLDQIVIGGFDSKWMPGMLYTALTRCRKAEGLYLQDFNPHCLKANLDGLKEIERIRKYSMIEEKIERLEFFYDYPPENWSFVALQNVRSLHMHIDDVLSDPIMKSSTILCLTETSLDDKNWPGWEKFHDYDLYQTLRNETNKNKSENLKKSGGVAILVKKSLPSGHAWGLENKFLEMTSAVTELTGDHNIVTCIYKDHEIPPKEFIDEMDKIFEQHSNHCPSIIAGDFNLYDDKDIHNGLLNSCALKHGYTPTVNEGTTVNNHLLDQIFISEAYQQYGMKTVILPSYFSDHSLVVLCLPK